MSDSLRPISSNISEAGSSIQPTDKLKSRKNSNFTPLTSKEAKNTSQKVKELLENKSRCSDEARSRFESSHSESEDDARSSLESRSENEQLESVKDSIKSPDLENSNSSTETITLSRNKKSITIIKDEEITTVKIKDLAKQLYVSEKVIVKAVEKGHYSQVNELIKKYELAFANFETKIGNKSQITAKQLMKVTSKAFFTLKDNESMFIKLGLFKGKVLVTKKDGQIEVSKKIKSIAKGSYGKVKSFQTTTLSLLNSALETERTAIKFSRESKGIKGEDSVKQEYSMLGTIHEKNKTLVGIQDKPHTFIKIISKGILSSIFSKGKSIVGFLGTLYHGDGLQLIKDKKFLGTQILDVMGQLFTGLKTLQDKGIRHGDIKTENILIRKFEDGFTAHLADFGGAKVLHDKLAPDQINRGAHSAKFTHNKDKEEMNRLQKKLTSNKSDKISESEFKNTAKEILFKGDVYSTAVSLYEMTTGILYDPNQKASAKKLQEIKNIQEALSSIEGVPSIPGGFYEKPLRDKDIPQPIIDLLKKALDDDYKNRPEPDEFLTALAAQKKGPQTV